MSEPIRFFYRGAVHEVRDAAPTQTILQHLRETQDGRRLPHLVVPYTLDSNDMRFAAMQGFNSGTQFFDYLKDAFDVLYAEGDPNGLDRPKMLSIGLHCRLVGRPARAAALARFLDYVQQHERVWITRRIDIANHWKTVHPFLE